MSQETTNDLAEELNDLGEKIEKILYGVFSSPNVMDSNLETANVVDVIADLACSVRYAGDTIKEGLQGVQKAIESDEESTMGVLDDIKRAIEEHE